MSIGTSGPGASAAGATSVGTLSSGRATSLPGFDPSAPLLQVTDLNVRFPTEDGCCTPLPNGWNDSHSPSRTG